MKRVIECFNIRLLCRQLEAETDETKRQMLVRQVSDHSRRLEKSMRDDEALHRLAVEELGHRMKNMVAAVQAIIAYQLREHKTARDTILQRLSALGSADVLIEASRGQGAFIKDIINTELGPYELSRATVEGPQIFLPPKLASVLALIIHELATNAAKHGALSEPSGHVSLCWSIVETKLILEWRESGGPIVTSPTYKGFGTRLLSRALGTFGGTVDLTFAATGLVSRMSLTLLPEASAGPPAVSVELQTPSDAQQVRCLSKKAGESQCQP